MNIPTADLELLWIHTFTGKPEQKHNHVMISKPITGFRRCEETADRAGPGHTGKKSYLYQQVNLSQHVPDMSCLGVSPRRNDSCRHVPPSRLSTPSTHFIKPLPTNDTRIYECLPVIKWGAGKMLDAKETYVTIVPYPFSHGEDSIALQPSCVIVTLVLSTGSSKLYACVSPSRYRGTLLCHVNTLNKPSTTHTATASSSALFSARVLFSMVTPLNGTTAADGSLM
uniref:Uncharacterized protein n=1 Tax=Timema tahoe TaxID=61484 RepID=A0A7R9IBN4_9NEOP|nr:unnamed protein product [Timema tahoe]